MMKSPGIALLRSAFLKEHIWLHLHPLTWRSVFDGSAERQGISTATIPFLQLHLIHLSKMDFS